MRFIKTILILSLSVNTVVAQTKPVVSILDLKMKCLLGGVQNKKWLADSRTAPNLKGKETYKAVGLQGAEEGVEIFLTKKIEKDGEPPCTDFYGADIVDSSTYNSGVAIETGANWNVSPRKVESLDGKNETYLKIVRDFAKSKGIAVPKIGEVQILRTDLEGDGTDEVVIAATYYKGGLAPSAAVGDYSFVLLRKVVKGAAQNILIAGDFHTKTIQFGAPGQYEINAIADLNGDGKMEIVTKGAYYEGNWAQVWEVTGVRVKEALSCACGA